MSKSLPAASNFAEVGLAEALLKSLNEAGYEQMTPVQASSLPLMLGGDDVVVQAQTGSGKTAAFALAILAKLDVTEFAPQALVLCPTRELAEQVAESIRKLAKNMANVKVLTLCGGVPTRFQIASLEHGAHILVGTPGRVLDHLNQNRLNFAKLQTLVLDEADRMLEMGFQDELRAIVAKTPSTRQNLLFSATYPNSIVQLTQQVSKQAQLLKVAETPTQAKISQVFYQLDDTDSAYAVQQILLSQQPQNCIVFCNTKAEAQRITDKLIGKGFSALALHGDLEQKDRDQTMVQFSHGSARVLVATDVAARGLDIAELDMVISVNIAHDLDTHTHRIGRTGRAGAEGLAVTLVGAQDDYKLRLLEDDFAEPIRLQALPTAPSSSKPLQSDWVTLQLSGGKKDKLRPGDIVGALTRDNKLTVQQIGKIKVQSSWAFVTVASSAAKHALNLINNDKIKGKRFRARAL
ncbi:ATP-dependent RNA helicase DbpA [Pseudidiomarina maritima]|uniref:ATP-dependent RNA helicase DbpA n=1 Tax=Pseudidiomarina maritima TaxID=519453 RepID=A0A1I6H9W1_9GAMM|nr:ATP-dependent RNA helicase DbpA [Pseudidiomarina maritima]SFR51295.1 ATP-dependent RNA helicase DbpA [Pseudidiomarina maritima]